MFEKMPIVLFEELTGFQSLMQQQFKVKSGLLGVLGIVGWGRL